MQIPAGTISFKFIFMYLFFRYGDQFYHVHQHVTTIARLLVRTEILERKRNGNIRARFHSDIAAVIIPQVVPFLERSIRITKHDLVVNDLLIINGQVGASCSSSAMDQADPVFSSRPSGNSQME